MDFCRAIIWTILFLRTFNNDTVILDPNQTITFPAGNSDFIIYTSPFQVTQDPSHPQTVQVAVNKPIGSTAQPTVRQLTFPMNTSGMQQIHVPGHKFHYVRLVSPATPQNSSVSGKRR